MDECYVLPRRLAKGASAALIRVISVWNSENGGKLTLSGIFMASPCRVLGR